MPASVNPTCSHAVPSQLFCLTFLVKVEADLGVDPDPKVVVHDADLFHAVAAKKPFLYLVQ
jgi:hypothetical protein